QIVDLVREITEVAHASRTRLEQLQFVQGKEFSPLTVALIDVQQELPVVRSIDVHDGNVTQQQVAREVRIGLLVELHRTSGGVIPLLNAVRLKPQERIDHSRAGGLGCSLLEKRLVNESRRS